VVILKIYIHAAFPEVNLLCKSYGSHIGNLSFRISLLLAACAILIYKITFVSDSARARERESARYFFVAGCEGWLGVVAGLRGGSGLRVSGRHG